MWYRRKPGSDDSEARENKCGIATEYDSDPTDSSTIVASRKRKVDHEEKECVASFKRVRMLSKTPITRLPRVENTNGTWLRHRRVVLREPNHTMQ